MSGRPARKRRSRRRKLASRGVAKRLRLVSIEEQVEKASKLQDESTDDSLSHANSNDEDSSDGVETAANNAIAQASDTSMDTSIQSENSSVVGSRNKSSSEDDANISSSEDDASTVDTNLVASLHYSVDESGVGGQLETEEAKEGYLRETLKEWAMRGVSTKKIDSLLRLLKVVHPGLPSTYKTLLQTPRNILVEEMGTGEFWFKGIARNIKERLSEENLQTLAGGKLEIDVNIDGLDLYKKGKDGKMWPILGTFPGFPEEGVFIIAVYCGRKKPDDAASFLRKYADEVQKLEREGIVVGEHTYAVEINNYILDAPATSLIKGTIGHKGEKACQKCMVIGEKVMGRMVYCDCNAALRTDENFRDRSDPRHHLIEDANPIEEIGTGMVSQFRLDLMHLVYIGVFKRFLEFLLGKLKNLPPLLQPREINELSRIADRVGKFVPHEFNRRPNNFEFFGIFKATEFRRLLLYDGLVVFSNLNPRYQKCYRLLHAGIYILSSPKLLPNYLALAEVFLRHFVERSQKVLGKHFCVYNVHSLIHLADECLVSGCLDEFSAFKFENFMGVIRRILRSTYKPLQQLGNRDAECGGCLVNCSDKLKEGEILLTGEGKIDFEGKHYSSIQFGGKNGTHLSVTESDGCFKTKNGEVVVLTDVIRSPQREIFLVGNKFRAPTLNFAKNSDIMT